MNWMKPALFSALAIGLLARAAAAEPLRYVALVDNGKKAGHQIVEQGDDGVTRVEFIFKDNGRGPELKEEFTLAPDGTYLRYNSGTRVLEFPDGTRQTFDTGMAQPTSSVHKSAPRKT